MATTRTTAPAVRLASLAPPTTARLWPWVLALLLPVGSSALGAPDPPTVAAACSSTCDSSPASSGVLLQTADGRLLVAASGNIERNERVANKVLAHLLGLRPNPTFLSGALSLMRLTPEGLADPSFGVQGTVLTPLLPLDNREFVAVKSLLQDSRGRLIVVGWKSQKDLLDGKIRVVLAARFTASGALDPTFGHGGVVTTRRDHDNVTVAQSAILDSEGRLLVVGYNGGTRTHGGVGNIDDWSNRLVLLRYTAKGVLDPSFGSGGIVSAALAPGPSDDTPDPRCQQSEQTCIWLRRESFKIRDRIALLDTRTSAGLTLDSAGRPLVAGTASDGTLYVQRYLPNGALDSGFGSPGATRLTLGSGFISNLLWDRAGRLLAVGTSDDGVVLLRYTSSGVLDDTFGSGGIRKTPLGKGMATSAAVRDTQGILYVAAYGASSLSVARYDEEGFLTQGFGVAGVMTSEFQTTLSGPAGMVLSDDGVPTVIAPSRDGVAILAARPQAPPTLSSKPR